MTPATFMKRYNPTMPEPPPIPAPEPEPKLGALRVWRIANIPNEATFHPVKTAEEGAKLINTLTLRDLRNPRIISNVFGMEVYEADGWHEWYNDNGQDVSDLADALL